MHVYRKDEETGEVNAENSLQDISENENPVTCTRPLAICVDGRVIYHLEWAGLFFAMAICTRGGYDVNLGSCVEKEAHATDLVRNVK